MGIGLTVRKIEELMYLLVSVVGVCLTMVLDRFRHSDVPTKIEQLTPEVLSTLIGRPVVEARNKRPPRATLAETGAGGTGTSRAWMELTFADGSTEHVFIKLPTPSFFEHVFLLVFGVYAGEMNFYSNLRAAPGMPNDRFAKILHVSMRHSRFVLIMEDVGQPRGKNEEHTMLPATIDPYSLEHAKAAMEAFAALHAPFLNRVPKGVWTDRWSAPRTVPPSNTPTRPRFMRLITDDALKKTIARYPGLLSQGVVDTYRLYLDNCVEVRRYWSTGLLTLAHGDSHLGNTFMYTGADGRPFVGFYDMQCTTAEHPMRDIVYNLASGYDADALERDERKLLEHYLSVLNKQLKNREGGSPLSQPLTYEEAYFHYRLHVLWVLVAYIISAGVAELWDSAAALTILPRLDRACRRLDTRGALQQVLDGTAPAFR